MEKFGSGKNQNWIHFMGNWAKAPIAMKIFMSVT